MMMIDNKYEFESFKYKTFLLYFYKLRELIIRLK